LVVNVLLMFVRATVESTARETLPALPPPVRPELAVTVVILPTPVNDDPSPTNVVADTEPLIV